MPSLACPLLLWQRSFGVTRIILSCHGFVCALVCSLWKPWEGFFSLVQGAMNMQADLTIFCSSLLLLSSPYSSGCAISVVLDCCSFSGPELNMLCAFNHCYLLLERSMQLLWSLVNWDMWCSLAGHIRQLLVIWSMITSFD